MKLSIKIIKKIKANFVRFKLHKIFGPFATISTYFGQLNNASAWIDKNKSQLVYNDFYNSNVKHSDRYEMYEFYKEHRSLGNAKINYIEFGVASGQSMKWWSSNNNNAESIFFGFDTFVGLPEGYGSYKAGTFDMKSEFPKIDDSRISFVKGLFQDTLIDKTKNIDFSGITIIHIDGDLYTSALYVLAILHSYLKKGDTIIFDEFIVPLHEFRAFQDYTSSFRIKLKPIAAINNYLQVIFEVE